MRTWRLLLCVNDHRNGAFLGECSALHLDLDEPGEQAELECDDGPIPCAYPRGGLLLGNVRVPVLGVVPWAGTWCWDCVTLRQDHLAQVLEEARNLGACGHCGPTEFFEGWKAGLAVAELLEGLEV